MICKQCKQAVPKKVKFCPNCGAPVVKEKKEREPLKKSFFVFWIEVLLVAGLVFGLTKTIAFSFGPEKVLNKYAKAILQDNWQEAFSCMDMEHTEFFSEEGYKKAVYTKISDTSDGYTLEQKRDKGDKVTYQINFTSSGSSSGQITVDVNQTKDKELYLFPVWKIDSSGNTVSNIVFNVPAGTEAYLDGAKVPDEWLSQETAENTDNNNEYNDFDTEATGAYNSYVIPKLYVGIHQFSCALNGSIMDEGNRDVEKDGDVVSLENVTLTKDMQQELVNALYESLCRYDTALMQGQDYSAVADLFKDNDMNYRTFEEVYTDLRDRSYAVNGLNGDVEYDYFGMNGTVNSFAYDPQTGYITADVNIFGDYKCINRYTYTFRWEVRDDDYEESINLNAKMVRDTDGSWKITSWNY